MNERLNSILRTVLGTGVDCGIVSVKGISPTVA